MNKKFIFFFIFILVFTSPIKSFSKDKIVFLDMNKVLNNSEVGKYINDQLKKKTKFIEKILKS